MNTQADILLVTATKVESLAVLDAFTQHTGEPVGIRADQREPSWSADLERT